MYYSHFILRTIILLVFWKRRFLELHSAEILEFVWKSIFRLFNQIVISTSKNTVVPTIFYFNINNIMTLATSEVIIITLVCNFSQQCKGAFFKKKVYWVLLVFHVLVKECHKWFSNILWHLSLLIFSQCFIEKMIWHY